MASNRATTHKTYDQYFLPLVRAIIRSDAEGENRAFEGRMTMQRGLDMRSRFYAWRKLFRQYAEKNSLAMSAQERSDLDMADRLVCSVRKDPENPQQCSFRIGLFVVDEFFDALEVAAEDRQLIERPRAEVREAQMGNALGALAPVGGENVAAQQESGRGIPPSEFRLLAEEAKKRREQQQ